MNNILHREASPLAGKTVRLKATARHHLLKEFGGKYIRIIDWFDRCNGRPRSMDAYSQISIQFSARYGKGYIPGAGTHNVDEVLYAKIDRFPVAVHISEIEPESPPNFPMAA
jgi:hypothetical protein